LAKETAKWKGIKVMVEMRVQNRVATLTVIPSAAPLLIKELGVCKLPLTTVFIEYFALN